MGVTVTNLEPGFHAQKNGAGATVLGWHMLLHHQIKGWNEKSGDVSTADFFACVTAAKTSLTAAASALASTWSGWWSGLNTEQRADAAQIWHASVTSGNWP